MNVEYLEMPNYEEREEIRQKIKDTRSQHYLFFVIGLGLPFVFWLLFRQHLHGLPPFVSALLKFTFFAVPPLVAGTFLLLEERQVSLFKQALENGVTHISEAIVEKVIIPPRVHRPSWGKRSYYNVKVARRRYWVDKKACNSLSVGDRVEIRCIPRTGLAFEIRKWSDSETDSPTIVYKSKFRADEDQE
jgi:hypothetical protein